MKVNIPIHLVKPKKYDALNDIYAVFDSKEKATHFFDRATNRPDTDIINSILDPYSVNKTATSYYISLAQTGSISKDIFMRDYNLNTEDRPDEYKICFYEGSKSSQGLFILKRFLLTRKKKINVRVSLSKQIQTNLSALCYL